MEVSDSGMAAGSFAAQLRVMRPGIEPSVKLVGLRVAGATSEAIEGRPDDDPEFVIYNAISGNLLPGAPQDVIIETTNGAWEVSASIDEYRTVELWFDDESTVRLYANEGDDDDPYVLDDGAALLEPITHAEHSAIERILSILGEAQQNGDLTPWQEQQIILMADLIRETRNRSVPDETDRSKVVPVVAGVLAYLFLQIPDGIVKWNEAIPILQEIGWSTTAGSLLGGG